MSEFPRRQCLHLHSPAEKAIRDAILEVEKAGAHPDLTEAVILLLKAGNKVADFVDDKLGPHTVTIVL